jgi:anti-sigma B factor antagonist
MGTSDTLYGDGRSRAMTVNPSELEPFRCEVEPDGATVRVRPVGELDLATVPRVDAELAELWSVGFTTLVVDLRSVTFLDSTGLRMLLAWQATTSADGIVFGVIPGPRVVERMLEVGGVADHLTTYWPTNGSGPPARTTAD